MTPGFAKPRHELPWLPYGVCNRVIINAHNFTPVAANYLLLDGVGDYALAPRIAAYDHATSIELIARCASDDWTNGNQIIIGNWTRAYTLFITTAGIPTMGLYNAAHTYSGKAATAAVPAADGAWIWLRCVYDGAAGTVQFYTGSDGVSWTQLGSTVTGATSTIYTGASFLFGMHIGIQDGGSSNPFKGKISHAKVIAGGVTVFDTDMSAVTPGAGTFAEASTNAATVTLYGNAAIIAG